MLVVFKNSVVSPLCEDNMYLKAQFLLVERLLNLWSTVLFSIKSKIIKKKPESLNYKYLVIWISGQCDNKQSRAERFIIAQETKLKTYSFIHQPSCAAWIANVALQKLMISW